MAQVHFYLLEQQNEQVAVPAHFAFACQLCAQLYRQGQRIFIYVENQQQAEWVDEYLWQFDASSFVAHNLQGEGPKMGAPVEIGYEVPKGSRQILINLAPTMAEFTSRFKQVFDFVPSDDALKQQARERYKQYRAAGHQLSTENVVS